MTAKQWPNKLGWNVGRAEVRDCGLFLRAFVPIKPKNKTDRHKRLDVPIGTSPTASISACRHLGIIHDDH